jgi:hypothetical protein
MKKVSVYLFTLVGMLWNCLWPATTAFAQTAPTPLNLTWKPREDVNVLLPASIRVFDTYSPLPGGGRIRAMYALIRTDDPNLRLRAVGDPRGSTFRLQTTKQAAQDNRAIFAVNGGFFATNESVSLILQDGDLIASNILSLVRNGRTYFPTRGAFGLLNRRPDVAWVYTLPNGQTVQYATPSPVDETLPPPPRPTETVPGSSSAWNASQAMGGGPILLADGQIRLTNKEELFTDEAFVGVNPRTAIGYRADNTLVVLVVDGRQRGSTGATLPQLAQMMQELGCREALNLDGGGSSTMMARDEVVNNPSNVDGGDRNTLRANASALVWTEATETPTRAVLVYDTDSPNYTEVGLWNRMNQSSFYGTTPARGAAPDNGSKAIYRFAGLPAGRYQLGAWWTVNETNAASVPYVLHRRNGRRDTLRVNQNDYETVAKWNVLGYFDLADGDYLELLAQGRGNRVVADAIRLVTMEQYPALPARGDLRIAVVSDLNSGLGSATYEWQVDSLMQRLPRIWKPDLVVCGGDMVAGQGPITNPATIRAMWSGFDRSVLAPIRANNIPFGFTIGNHDGVRSAGFALERSLAKEYWDTTRTNLPFVDRGNYPYYYSFKVGDVFVASWDASQATITDENLNWLRAQLATPQARSARLRYVMGHLPLYSVAQERDAPGNILDRGDELRKLLQDNNVQTYISGHHHAYFPAKRGQLEMLNAGAAGSGPRQWLTLDRAATNSVTIMDVFYGKNGRKDTTVYTTYRIAYENPADMPLLDYKTLPRIIYGYNGTFTLRRDQAKVPTGNRARLSAVHLEIGSGEKATGEATADYDNNQIFIRGTFSNLQGTLPAGPETVALFAGRAGESGTLVAYASSIQAATDGRNGSFTFQLLNPSEALVEQFIAGATYLIVKSTRMPAGELRGQLLEVTNRPPAKAAITGRNDRNVYAVRNIEAIFEIGWNEAPDPEGDPISYVYQVATDSTFSRIVLENGTGRVRSLKRTEADWYALLGNTPAGEARTFYHRLISTDGYNSTYGDPQRFMLTKSDAPLDELVEVPAPAYRFDGRLPNAPNGYGATYDGEGKLWYVDFSANGGAVYVERPNGTAAPFSPLSGTALGGNSNNTGIGTDRDGNILLSRNSRLFKINARTGQVIATWQSPARANGSANTLTVPQPATNGEVYVPSLWNDDFLYVLRQNGATFEQVRRVTLPGRILSRSFAMEADGRTLYLPNPGAAQVQKFVSTNSTTYTLADEITSLAAGSSGIRVTADGKVYMAVRSSGVLPTTIHFRDEANKRLWTLPLPDLGNVEPRGLGVSPSGDTLIISGWNSTGTYRYVRMKPGTSATRPPAEAATARQAATEVTHSVGVFPNPVTDLLTINTETGRIESVYVTTTQGRQATLPVVERSERVVRLDASGLMTGVYLLTVRISGEVVTRRFLKQ